MTEELEKKIVESFKNLFFGYGLQHGDPIRKLYMDEADAVMRELEEYNKGKK